MTYKTYKITKITKSIIQNYIKFELNDNIRFSDKNKNFVFCPNEYPFKSYRVGDGIEVDITNAKFMSSQNYHQDIIRKVSSNYVEGFHDDYEMPRGSNSRVGTERTQGTITLSAYETKAAYEFLYGALEWLELYIEKANYYPNWQQKKQLPKTITRPDIPYLDAKETKEHFLTSLSGLKAISIGKPSFLLEKLQTEFFSWLDGSGIGVNSCPAELTQSLVDFHSILIGKAGEFTRRRRKEVDENIAKMTSEEKQKNFHEIVAAYQEPLENEDKVFETMKGKTYKDVNNESKFDGNADQGKEIFKQIEGRQSASSSGGGTPRNQEIRWDLIIEIDQNKNDWEVRKETITYDRYGREKKDDVLILKTTKLDSRDYNQATGELINQPGKVYRQDYFSEKEWVEITAIFGVSTSTNQPINKELVDKIDRHRNEFSLERLFVSNGRGGYDEEDWLIHNSAKRKSDKDGCLVFDSDKMVKIKELSEAEQKAIGYKSEQNLQDSSVSTSKKDNNKGIGKGGVIAIIAVMSALLIGSVVVVKKRLGKKVKSR